MEVDEGKAGVFQIGQLFHEHVNRVLKDSGLMVKSVEAPFILLIPNDGGFFRIEGRADLIVSFNDEDYILEVKSVRKLPDTPFKHHIQQTQIYLAAYGLQKGFIIYLEKQALQHRIFEVTFNAEDFKHLLKRAKSLHEALTNDSEPEPDAEAWECRFCEFRNKCGRGGRG